MYSVLPIREPHTLERGLKGVRRRSTVHEIDRMSRLPAFGRSGCSASCRAAAFFFCRSSHPACGRGGIHAAGPPSWRPLGGGRGIHAPA